MKNISIISIIPYKILPARLGGEKGIAVFNQYLSKEVKLTGVTTRNNDPSLAKGYRLLNILSNTRWRYVNIFLYFNIRKIIRREKATHLLIEHPYYGWLGWLLRRTLPIKLIVHSHNIEYMRSRSINRSWWKWLKWYEGWAYRTADYLFFISDDDRESAIKYLRVDPSKAITVTFGIELNAVPSDIAEQRQMIQAKHNIKPDEKILLFNGALYHSTNYDALQVILDQINPLLLEQKDFSYKIIICGKGLPEFFNDLKDYTDKNIIYAGFVDNIEDYFKAADIFLNPILTGGGVKTKAIEALAMNCTVISTPLGALGINQEVCGGKLLVAPQDEWKKFRDLIITAPGNNQIPSTFFKYYYWENVVKKAVKKISNA